jgi:hypothetical protein
MKQVTPGTLGSSKSLTQTLSFGESRLRVVLTQDRSSAETAHRGSSAEATRQKGNGLRAATLRPSASPVSVFSKLL